MLINDYVKMEVISSNTKRQLTKMYADHEMPLKRYVKSLKLQFVRTSTIKGTEVVPREERDVKIRHCSGTSGTMS